MDYDNVEFFFLFLRYVISSQELNLQILYLFPVTIPQDPVEAQRGKGRYQNIVYWIDISVRIVIIIALLKAALKDTFNLNTQRRNLSHVMFAVRDSFRGRICRIINGFIPEKSRTNVPCVCRGLDLAVIWLRIGYQSMDSRELKHDILRTFPNFEDVTIWVVLHRKDLTIFKIIIICNRTLFKYDFFKFDYSLIIIIIILLTLSNSVLYLMIFWLVSIAWKLQTKTVIKNESAPVQIKGNKKFNCL